MCVEYKESKDHNKTTTREGARVKQRESTCVRERKIVVASWRQRDRVRTERVNKCVRELLDGANAIQSALCSHCMTF